MSRTAGPNRSPSRSLTRWWLPIPARGRSCPACASTCPIGACPRIVLDHHLTQEDWADLKLVIPEAAAAGEIAAELLEQWEIPLDPQIATCLYLAIVSDTGWFQFSNTRPFTLRLAATLMEAGVDTDKLYQLLYQSERPQRVALQRACCNRSSCWPTIAWPS